MIRAVGAMLLSLLALVFSAATIQAADIDRAAVDFKTPAEIKWVRNAADTNESAVLFGDPSKPGPYVVRIKWFPGNGGRPHFHPNDRFFCGSFRHLVDGNGRKVRSGQHGAGSRRKLRHSLRRQNSL